MSSIIRATTTSGLQVAPDNSGSLVLQTNGTTTALTIDTSQNITTVGNIRLNNGAADGAQVTFASSGYSDWNIDNYSGRLRAYYNATEYFTIDTSGNVGIGTTSPTTKFTVASASDGKSVNLINGSGNTSLIQFGSNAIPADAYTYIKADGRSTGYLAVSTNDTERMRIDSSGNFLVGTTTGLDGGNGATIKQASYYISSYRVSTTTGNYIHAFYSDVGGTATAKYAIYANGTAGAISDERYKKNIEPSRNYLDDITKINVIKYNWATDDENTPKELGFSAQQVETIFPGLVDTVDNKDADGNVLINQKILKRDVFLPMLVKAIQEQQTIINDLKARIETLESK